MKTGVTITDEFGFEGDDLAANIITMEIQKAHGLLDDAAALKLLGPSYRRVAQDLAVFLESDTQFFFRRFNVGAARSLRRIAGITPEGVIGDARSLQVLRKLDEAPSDAAADKAIRRERNSRRIAAGISVVSPPLRAVLLARAPLLVLTDSATRAGALVNDFSGTGQFKGVTKDMGQSVAKWFKIWKTEIGNARGTDAQFHELMRASQSAQLAARIDTSRFGAFVNASVFSNRVAQNISKFTGHAAQNYASTLAARQAVNEQAGTYARNGVSYGRLKAGQFNKTTSQYAARAWFEEVGRYIPEAAWNRFIELGGSLGEFGKKAGENLADRKLYEQLDRALLQRAKVVSGEGTERNRYAFAADPSQAGTAQAELINFALVFTRYINNISIAYAQRSAALWRAAGKPGITDWDRSQIMARIGFQAMGQMFIVGAFTILVRDYVLRNRDLDPDDETEMARFVGKSIAYSNMFGVLGDLLGAGIAARNEDAVVSDIVRGRIPGVFIGADLISSLTGATIGAGWSTAFNEEGFDYDNWAKNSRDLVRNFWPKNFATAAVADYIVDRQTREDELAAVFSMFGDRLTKGQRPFYPFNQYQEPGTQATTESFDRFLDNPNLLSENW